MGASISKEKIEQLSIKKLKKVKPSTVRDLKPEVKAIYDHRMLMLLITAETMENHVDIMQANYQPHDLKYMMPEVREIHERRVKHHNMICDLLENNMVEVTDQVKQAITNDDGDEDEKQ